MSTESVESYWFDSPEWKWVGCCEFGHNSIHDFELYQHQTTGEIAVMYHDDPSEQGDIDSLIDFGSEYDSPKYADQCNDFLKLMAQLGKQVWWEN